MTTDNDAIIEKIQKLLNLATDPRTPQGEADAAMNRANLLMAKHQLDETILRAAGKKVNGKIPSLITYTIEEMPWSTYKQRASLYHVVARVNDVIVRTDHHRKGEKARLFFYGYDTDVEHVLFLATQLDLDMFNRSPSGYYERRSFLTGYIIVVNERLQAARMQVIDEAKEETPGIGLAIIEKSKQVADFAGRGGRTPARRAVQTSESAYDAGRSAGANADIGQGRIGNQGPRALNS